VTKEKSFITLTPGGSIDPRYILQLFLKNQIIGLFHPPNDFTNPKYKFLHFLTTNFLQREEGNGFKLG
jgi:hypothetical protein